jgi:hypothetical protein
MNDLFDDIDDRPLSEIEELTWTMIDDQLTEAQIRRLEQLVTEDKEARQIFLTCMNLHVELERLFRGENPPAPSFVLPAGVAASDIPQSVP